MSKVIVRSNYRVTIEPRRLGDFGGIRVSDSMFYSNEEVRQKAYKDRCEEIIDQVKRHVDNIGHVEIDFDTETKCSHCGYDWEVDETGLPQCCDKAQEEFEAQTPTSTILTPTPPP